MHRKLTRLLAALAVVATATASLVLGLAGSAYAVSPGSPWQSPTPPAAEVGTLTFYNASGQQITGGNLTDSPIAAYIQGSAALQTGATKATVNGVTPVSGEAPGQWTGENLSGPPTTYPNSGAPTALASSSLPLATITAASGESLATYISDYPNNDTSTTDGYGGVYELRLFTSNSGGTSTNYDAADILVSGSTWSVVYPTVTLTSTTTTLTESPPSPQVSSSSVELTATVSPSAPGTVQFEYGTTPTLLGSPVTVAAGTASLSTTALPVGTDDLSAVFTPAQFSAYSGSTGTSTYTISPSPAANTATALGVNPSTAAADTAVSLTATVSSGGNPLASGTGTVDFYDNGTNTADTASGTELASVAVGAGGVATLSYSSFAVGAHNIVAEFLPTNTATYNSSLSPSVLFTATAPTYAPDAQTVQVGIPAGTLTITTPYGPGNPFQLGTATLNPADSEFTASASFGTPATDGTTDAGGVTITDTRAGDLPWTASAEVGNFTDGATPTPDVINGQNLAFTDVTPSYISGNALQSPDVTTTNVTSTPPGGTPYGPSATGTDGLGGEPHEFASATAGAGEVYVNGLLSLTAPTSTPAGTYTATLTFTIS
jgi:hypothetical protein